MQDTQLKSGSNATIWTGRIVSGVVVAFLIIASALPKLIGHVSATEAFARLGYPEGIGLTIGLLELGCAVLYAIPRTSVLGAIVLTGLLGGATATHVRVSDPWFIFPVVFGVLAWAGLFLRERRLHELLPLRKEEAAWSKETALS